MTKSKDIYYENTGEAHNVLKSREFYISAPQDNKVQVKMLNLEQK